MNHGDAVTRSGEVWYSGSFVGHGVSEDDILRYSENGRKGED